MDTDEVLEALFAIHKYAREYAGEATDAYESGWKGQARKNSIRKEALYRRSRLSVSGSSGNLRFP
jgi:hypothetical protein